MDSADQLHDNDVRLSDLRQMNCRTPSLTFHPGKAAAASTTVMKGSFRFRNYCGGLSLHGGQVMELVDMKTSFELPPGLSFNIVFSGEVGFTMGGESHLLGGCQQSLPQCGAIVTARPETVTRLLRKGNSVRKINVSAERRWLEQRCETTGHSDQLRWLFGHHARVFRWQPSVGLCERAGALLTASKPKEGLSTHLQQEAKAMDLLACCVDELLDSCQADRTQSRGVPLAASHHALKDGIDQCIQQDDSLQTLAEKLNMSVSTMQRKFKAAFGITVIDYVRQRRLEFARRALVDDGVSIGQAAYLAGYKYPSNFVTAFKRQYSMTPSEFKNGHL